MTNNKQQLWNARSKRTKRFVTVHILAAARGCAANAFTIIGGWDNSRRVTSVKVQKGPMTGALRIT